MGDSSGVLVVVHEQELEVGEVSDEEFFVAGRKEVLGLFVGTVTDLGHGELTLESSSDLERLVVHRGWSRCESRREGKS